MSISPSFQRHIQETSAAAAVLSRQVVNDTIENLRSAGGFQGAGVRDRQQFFALMESLQRQKGAWADAFERHLVGRLREALDESAAPRQRVAPALNLDELSLVDENQAAEDIEISRIVALIDLKAEWELRELQAFTATLRGETQIRREANPARPEVYARALSRSTHDIAVPADARVLLLRSAGEVLASTLKQAYAQMSRRLERDGVEPLAFRAVPQGSMAATIDITDPAALGQLLERVRASAGAAAQGDAAAAGTVAGSLDITLNDLNHRIDAQHLPVAADGPQVGMPNVLRQLQPAAGGAGDVSADPQVIELLSRLFDQILADKRLMPAVKGVLGRLQVSVLRVALRDPSLLRQHDHPTWQLLNRLAAHCVGYDNPADERLTDFLRFMEDLIGRVAASSRPDAQLYRNALQEVNDFIDAKSREAMEKSRAALEKLQRIERRDQLCNVLRQQIRQMKDVEVSTRLRDFLFGPWVDAMVEAMVRFGEQDERTAEMLQTVDELLWTLQPPRTPGDRDRLRAMLPELVARLNKGMDLVKLPQSQRDGVMAELMAHHSTSLRNQAAPRELTPEEIVQRMRDEADPTSTHGRLDGVDRGALPTVPVGLMTEDGSDAGRRARQAWMARLQPGTWFHMFVQGDWETAQLMWSSEDGQFFMFASHMAGQSHSLTRRAIERLLAEGLIAVLEERPLVQRAFDSVLQDLDAPLP